MIADSYTITMPTAVTDSSSFKGEGVALTLFCSFCYSATLLLYAQLCIDIIRSGMVGQIGQMLIIFMILVGRIMKSP